MEADDRFLTETDVARLLGISPRTLQAWRYRGGHTPQFIKVGRAVRYRLGDVRAWLDERRRRSTSDLGPEV
jgi:predicted DNA-binding transcriptional regulator AlpA